jgi:cysteine desulfurase
MQPILLGGEQEKGLRAGTESVHNIVGMAKALEISLEQLDAHRAHVLHLRQYLLNALQLEFPGFKINGAEDGFYNILNVLLPFAADKTAMILFHLDMKGIAVSRGSACQSGSITPSHVLAQMLSEDDLKKPSLRISLSHLNTQDDIDYLMEALKTV